VDQLLADEQLSALPPVNGQSSGYDQTTPGTVVWALTDNENTVRDLAVYTPGPGGTQGTTAIVNHRVYDSFGNLVNSTNPTTGQAAAVDCVFGYTGEMFDQITGLQYNWQRWYDPSTGRWMSQDPSGIVGSEDANLYRYCGNGPITFVDSDGLGTTSIDTGPGQGTLSYTTGSLGCPSTEPDYVGAFFSTFLVQYPIDFVQNLPDLWSVEKTALKLLPIKTGVPAVDIPLYAGQWVWTLYDWGFFQKLGEGIAAYGQAVEGNPYYMMTCF
jgi:RHS repeat-associated protein